jgi:hypothetical protein
MKHIHRHRCAAKVYLYNQFRRPHCWRVNLPSSGHKNSRGIGCTSAPVHRPCFRPYFWPCWSVRLHKAASYYIDPIINYGNYVVGYDLQLGSAFFRPTSCKLITIIILLTTVIMQLAATYSTAGPARSWFKAGSSINCHQSQQRANSCVHHLPAATIGSLFNNPLLPVAPLPQLADKHLWCRHCYQINDFKTEE